MKKENIVYVFSGLGADERVFQKINFGNFEPKFIKWIKPQNNESLQAYSLKIIQQITTANPILIGISFGAIIVQEVASIISTKKIFLLASVENKNEIPYYLRLCGKLQIDRIVPACFFKTHNRIADFFFGINNNEESFLLKSILAETDSIYLKWALRKIATWQASPLNLKPNLITIHGAKDRILPIAKGKKYNFIIPNAGHFFTITNFNEINIILEQELNKL